MVIYITQMWIHSQITHKNWSKERQVLFLDKDKQPETIVPASENFTKFIHQLHERSLW